MTHPIVKTVSGLVYEGDIDSAERALAVIADQEGDRALARIIEEMPPRDLVAILREHDASRMSIVGELISPAQFAAAVALERAYNEKNHDRLRGMVNAVVFADEDRSDDYIVALGAGESGLNALCDYFSDRHEELERFFRNGTFNPHEGEEVDGIPVSNLDLQLGELDEDSARDVVPLREVQDHDWHELTWRLRCDHYEVFRDMMEMLRARHHRAAAMPPPPKPKPLGLGLDDDDEDDVL